MEFLDKSYYPYSRQLSLLFFEVFLKNSKIQVILTGIVSTSTDVYNNAV